MITINRRTISQVEIRQYQPGQAVTLYDYRKHKSFKGRLYVAQSVFPHPMWEPRISLPEITLPTNLWERLAKMFLGLSVLGFVWIFFPPIYSEISYKAATYFKLPQVIPALAEVPISDEFYLEIPKINLTSQIISNVDSSNEESYLEKLKKGVAHAKGSYFPGENGPIVLFSHSTDTLSHIVQYNARFYSLKDLEIGDFITIHFKGKIYNYTVSDKKIINPADLNSIRQSNSKLILTTCWPPGTDWQRIAVFAS